MAEGLQKNPPTMSPRLRLNGVLNAVTRRGPFLGNSAGVVALVYNGTNSTIGYWRGKHDITNSVVAGAISGAIFKSTRGLRPMMISAGIVSSVAGTWAVSCSSFRLDIRKREKRETNAAARYSGKCTSSGHKFNIKKARERKCFSHIKNTQQWSHISAPILSSRSLLT